MKSVSLSEKFPQCKKIGTHYVHVGSASAEKFSGFVKTLHS